MTSSAAARPDSRPDASGSPRPEAEAPWRTTALVVAVVGALAFALVAWWRIPWDAVPGGRLTPVPATSAFDPAQIARAEEYSRWARVWGWGSLALSLVVALVLGLGPWGGRVMARLARLTGRWWLQVPLGVALLLLVGRLVTLPLAAAAHVHQTRAGLTRQGWAGFARDLAVGEAITIVTTGLAVLAVVACARRAPRRWPAVAAGLAAALVLLGSFVYPVLVEPLMNRFTPLPDGPLRSEILRLAQREGVPLQDVLVADASRRTTTLNAYVSGYGSTRRVVLYDTLLQTLDRRETLSVVAHELTHAREDDVLTGSVLGALGAATAVGLLGLALGRRRPEAATVPRVLALAAVATLLAAPVQNTLSRQIEIRADVGALEATGDPAAFEAMQRQLGLRSLNDPTPPAWSQLWFGSHPTVLTRLALAERMARG
ncbi:M48 family metallopeptidase [Nocardioides sp. TRM66260-LWL]|uniref:M48 family metallopeptidase n=1 Tax=Nocardioides sp. TRM66260-LWL TaxID=2874478 RepID=UPI001CC413B3|nr:M48 family metallopeptidase [Nocardioides sp. TRM66260-LWL]MBZ5734314.1 M48 family metallopeptidase [Nocardioides sp. TRM66260-LWL]